MLAMVWDDALAATAKKHAETCKFEHSQGGGFGENLAAGTPDTYPFENLVVAWRKEKVDFKYPTTCNAGKVCGHYTQQIWATSDKVGCGIAVCPKDSVFTESNSRYLVCQYLPPYVVFGHVNTLRIAVTMWDNRPIVKELLARPVQLVLLASIDFVQERNPQG
ncbi:Peptidase inhibitor 16 [Cichlidogyrus casuarinus]|uniref:Peptidase inhibitor 16 n=1 Tax=Cichlidogyrus casuarinus TaxID=1844966 RepID=A0ABD2PKP3_9PLAT